MSPSELRAATRLQQRYGRLVSVPASDNTVPAEPVRSEHVAMMLARFRGKRHELTTADRRRGWQQQSVYYRWRKPKVVVGEPERSE